MYCPEGDKIFHMWSELAPCYYYYLSWTSYSIDVISFFDLGNGVETWGLTIGHQGFWLVHVAFLNYLALLFSHFLLASEFV